MAVRGFKPPVSGALTRQSSDTDGEEKRSLLYVEDEDVNWELAEAQLNHAFHLRRARNAREVFEALHSSAFDVILMDIQLAGSEMNGIEITEALKRRNGRPLPPYAKGLDLAAVPPIIFVTAYTANFGKDRLFAAGGDDLITKPVNFAGLSFAIARVILRHSKVRKDDPKA